MKIKFFTTVKMSDRPISLYTKKVLKRSPLLRETLSMKRWELSREKLKLKISYCKVFRDLVKKVWKK